MARILQKRNLDLIDLLFLRLRLAGVQWWRWPGIGALALPKEPTLFILASSHPAFTIFACASGLA